MDTEDGFIVGVYNYCDRWCERCTLASRCRLFVEEQRVACELPPAPAEPPAEVPLPVAVRRSLGAAAWVFQDVIDEPRDPADLDELAAAWREPTLTPREAELKDRIGRLSDRLWAWVAPEAHAADPRVKEAAAVLQHFGARIRAKIARALRGRHDDEWQAVDSDANGTAKVVLGALDRLGDAWLQLAEYGVTSVTEAAPHLAEIQHLTGEVETLFPRARGFVRPGFDEPEAVAYLEWSERG